MVRTASFQKETTVARKRSKDIDVEEIFDDLSEIMNEHIAAMTSLTEIRLKRSEVLRAVDETEELPGDMPEELWRIASESKESCQDIMRIVVSLTKREIRDRIEALK
jgi:hypothetical protein